MNALLRLFDVEGDETLTTALSACLTQLADSTEDDARWKYLNYQVLLCLRNPSATIRGAVLDVVSSFVDAKGENYLSVLPDAVPFLAETLEDEEPHLEEATKSLISKMEEIFGQSVQSYFEY